MKLRFVLLGAVSFSSLASAQEFVLVSPSATDAPPVVVAGDATFSTDATGMVRTVTQTTDRAVLDWSTLNVQEDHTLRFSQPDANAITLNRVTGSSLSMIDGVVEANGQVWILNPNGVIISPSGQVTTSGFLAATGNIAHTDFMNSTGQFAIGSNGSSGFIYNQGSIATGLGYTVINAASVQNSGQITASRGTVVLASVDNLSISLDQGQLISYDLSNNSLVPTNFRDIANSGTISAEGGLVVLSMASALGAISGVINVDGLIEASSVQSVNGKIILDAGPNAALNINGVVNVEGNESGEVGGIIEARGSLVAIGADAFLNANGNAGGGQITLAANPEALFEVNYDTISTLESTQDSDPFLSSTASQTSANSLVQSAILDSEVLGNGALASIEIHQDGLLSASAIETGDGGIVQADADGGLGLGVKVSGLIKANGAGSEGNGGEITLRGFYLDINGATLEASAGSQTASPGNVELTAASIDLVDQLASADIGVLNWQSQGSSLPFYEVAELEAFDLQDLEISDAVPIGFDFLYFGETFDTVKVTYDGILTFGNLNGDSLCCDGWPLFDIEVPPSIFGLWTDLGIEFDPGSSLPNTPSGKPLYGTFDLGNGLKEFVVQWRDVPEFPFEGTGNTFEIRIRSDGAVLLNYGDLDVANHAVTAGLTGRTLNDTSQLFFVDVNSAAVLEDFSQTSAIFLQPDPVSQISKQSIEEILNGGSNVSINAREFTDANSSNLAIGNIAISGPSSLSLLSGGPAQQIILGADKDIKLSGDQVLPDTLAAQLASDVNGDGIGGAIRTDGLLEAGQIEIAGDVIVSGSTEIRALGTINIQGDIATASGSSASSVILDAGGVLAVNGTIGDVSTSFVGLRSESLDAQAIQANQVDVDLFSEGTIAGTVVAGLLSKFGTGDLTLSGSNGNLVDLKIAGGSVSTASADSVGGGTIILEGGELNFTHETPIQLTNRILVDQLGAISFAGSGTIAGQVDSVGTVNAEFSVKAGGDLTFTGGLGTNDVLESINGTADGRITLGADARLIASNAIDLAGASGFTNLSSQADVLSSAEWSIWSGNPNPFGGNTPDNTGALQHDWRYYGISEAQVLGSEPLPERPDGAFGLAYGIAPVLTPQLGASLSKTYDGTRDFTASSIILDFDGLINDDSLDAANIGTALANVADVSASEVTLSGINASFTDTSGKPVFGYQFSSTITAPASILPRPLFASLIGSVSRDYDGTTDALLTSENFNLDGLVLGETITVTQTTGDFVTRNVGDDLTISTVLAGSDFTAGAGTNLSNYLLPTNASGAIGSILPLTLLYIADPATRFEGSPNPVFSGSVTGFLQGETLADATTGNLIFSSPATVASEAGNYSILGSGLSAINYVFEQDPANSQALTIQPNIISQVSSITGSSAAPPPAPPAANQPLPGDAPPSDQPPPEAAPPSDQPPPGDAPPSDQPPSGETLPPQQSSAQPSPGQTPAGQAPAQQPVQPSPGQPGPTVVAVDVQPADPLPPSPVGEEPTPTPNDPEDVSDPVLAALSNEQNGDVTTANATQAIIQLTPSISVLPRPQIDRPSQTNNALSINSSLRF